MLGSGTKKQRADLLSSSAASFTKTKATISPLPGLGWSTVPKKLRCVCVCSSVFYNNPPSLSLFQHTLSLQTHRHNDQCRTLSSLGIPTFSETTPHPIQGPSHFEKSTLTPRLLSMQMWGWIRKFGDRWSQFQATRHSRTLKIRSEGSNYLEGIIFTQ